MNQPRQVGSYRLEKVLGSGATGQVWASVDQAGQRWAFKLLRSDLAEDQSVVRRFLAERAVLLRISDPHVVGMHDLVAEQGQLGIVMDLVEGGSLRQVLGLHGPFPPAQVAQIAAGIAQGLAALHAGGVVHRDVKPENVMMDSTNGYSVPRLTDFGIAKVLDSGDAAHRSTALVGTPAYMAPELADGEPASAASDLYALGIVMYELLCGVTPFKAPTPLAMLRLHADQLPGRLDGVPDLLWSVIASLLAKPPKARPSSAREVMAECDQIAGRCEGLPALALMTQPPSGARVDADRGGSTGPDDDVTMMQGLVGGGGGLADVGADTLEGGAPEGSSRGRHRGRYVAAGVVTLLLLGGGGAAAVGLVGGGSHHPAAAASSTTTTTTAAAATPTDAATSNSPSVTSSSAPATMPNVVGMTIVDAQNELSGVTVNVSDVVSQTVADGTVTAQSVKVGQPIDGPVTLTVATQPASTDLTQLATVATTGNQFQTGPEESAKQNFPLALDNQFCQNGNASQSSISWNLSGDYQQFEASIGQDDTSTSTDDTAQVQVIGDNRVLFEKTIAFGSLVNVDVDVTGVSRLVLEVNGASCDQNNDSDAANMVIGGPVALGLPSEVPTPSAS